MCRKCLRRLLTSTAAHSYSIATPLLLSATSLADTEQENRLNAVRESGVTSSNLLSVHSTKPWIERSEYIDESNEAVGLFPLLTEARLVYHSPRWSITRSGE